MFYNKISTETISRHDYIVIEGVPSMITLHSVYANLTSRHWSVRYAYLVSEPWKLSCHNSPRNTYGLFILIFFYYPRRWYYYTYYTIIIILTAVVRRSLLIKRHLLTYIYCYYYETQLDSRRWCSAVTRGVYRALLKPVWLRYKNPKHTRNINAIGLL